jgi:hypothetical protein
MKQPYPPTGKAIEATKGLSFDLNSWDGSDTFTPEKSKFTFVTKKIRNLWEASPLPSQRSVRAGFSICKSAVKSPCPNGCLNYSA